MVISVVFCVVVSMVVSVVVSTVVSVLVSTVVFPDVVTVPPSGLSVASCRVAVRKTEPDEKPWEGEDSASVGQRSA